MEEVKIKKSLGQLLHDKRVSGINRAYAVYKLEPNEANLNDLLKEVISLARKKLRLQAEQVGDFGMEDDDDFAQKVALTVWRKMTEGADVPFFYEWVMKIILNHRLHLFRDLRLASDTHRPLLLQDEDGNDYDNPEVYTESGHGTSSAFRIPEGLAEEDETICYMIADKWKYEEIAGVLGLGLRTIKRRVATLKERFGAEVQVA